MKFHKAVNNDDSVAIYDHGEFETSEFGATVSYKFDPEDHSVRLNIEEQWFTSKDVDELISFLQFTKTQHTK
jgi:hypothetical protein